MTEPEIMRLADTLKYMAASDGNVAGLQRLMVVRENGQEHRWASLPDDQQRTIAIMMGVAAQIERQACSLAAYAEWLRKLAPHADAIASLTGAR